MPRPRGRKTAGLPPYVYCNHGRWFHRPPGGRERRLAAADASIAEVWQAYLALPKDEPPAQGLTLQALVTEYMASLQFRKLAPGTQADAVKSFRVACAQPASGKPFGDWPARVIDPVSIRGYLDRRGEKSEKRANAEVAYLSMAFGWAMERGKVAGNPCAGVRRFKIAERTRYVEDAEYEQRYTLVGALGRPDLQAMMEIAYLCRLRENEVLRTLDTARFMAPDGLLAVRGKGSKTQVIAWSPRLQAAVQLARSVPRRTPTASLIVSPHTGAPLTLAAFRSAWQVIRREAHQRGHAVDWHFHDLKAKGVTDFDGDKHKASGHKTHRMTEVYNRLPETVKSTR